MIEKKIGDLVVRISRYYIDLFQGGEQAVNITLSNDQSKKLADLISIRIQEIESSK